MDAPRSTLLFLTLLMSIDAMADNAFQHNGISKVYDPYVQPLEKELEYRTFYQTDGSPSDDDIFRQQLGVGASVSEHIFMEAYVLGKKLPRESFRMSAYEIETRVQLTQQGQYNSDWGLLFELGKTHSLDVISFSSTILAAREFGRWTGTLNIGAGYEFGADVENAVDYELAGKLSYRHAERLEPALEYYIDEFTRGIGPILQGTERLANNRKFHWEAGILFPLKNTTPDSTLKLVLELEF